MEQQHIGVCFGTLACVLSLVKNKMGGAHLVSFSKNGVGVECQKGEVSGEKPKRVLKKTGGIETVHSRLSVGGDPET